MNIIDLLLILVILVSIVTGWQKGFIVGIVDLVIWVGSLLAGFIFYPYLASFFDKYINSLGVWTLPLAFIITIIFARIILGFIMNNLLRATPDEAHRNFINKFFGIIPGAINGVVWAIIISAMLLSIPFSDGLSARTRDSKIANNLGVQAEWLNEKLSPVFDKAINQTINKLTIHPESNKSVTLPFRETNSRVREDLEAKMLELINEERAKNGLKALKADPELTIVARHHSKDMFVRGYFAHVNPEGKNPFDRMNTAGVKYMTAGENLALAQSLSIAHEGLMNSPGHRANILNPQFGRVGIGILDGGFHGLMISQEFRN